MSSPLYKSIGQNQGGMNPATLRQKFLEFKQMFQGDPRQKVQELLNSGRMSQDQFNKLRGMAQQFQAFFK